MHITRSNSILNNKVSFGADPINLQVSASSPAPLSGQKRALVDGNEIVNLFPDTPVTSQMSNDEVSRILRGRAYNFAFPENSIID